MMQSTAQTVDEYLKEVAANPQTADRLAALQRLRRLCRKHLRGYEESMLYGGPCYSRAGIAEVGFASQKNNIALYILRKDVLDAYRAEFPPSTIGKGCIRYRNPAKIDFGVVEKMLIATRQADGPIC
ncbi:MAG: DUF1801 domain-containing protein [Chloroflexi bacterium]|nr:DUF1801 domain-containing protein [Chloroflexota bacterium]